MLIWLKVLNGVRRHFKVYFCLLCKFLTAFSGGLRGSRYSFIDSFSIPLIVNLRGKSILPDTCRELASLLCILELFQKFQQYFPSDYDSLFKLSALFSVAFLLLKIPDIHKAVCSLARRFRTAGKIAYPDCF